MNAQYNAESATSETLSSGFLLLQQAMNDIQQGNARKGIELLLQAREQIVVIDTFLASVLDATVQICMEYRQTKLTLLEASRNFAKAEADQQVQLQSLAQILSLAGQRTEFESSRIIPFHQPIGDTLLSPDILLPTQSTFSQSISSPHEVDDQNASLPALSITLFGHFTVVRGDRPLDLCRSSNGQAILQYLAAQPGFRAAADILMDILWPDDEPDIARHKLQVAVSVLRRSLNQGYRCEPGGGYILFKHQVYQINPLATLRTDVNQFLQLYQVGRHGSGADMVAAFKQACSLYVGSFLAENLYADWTLRRREQLCQNYLAMCSELAAYYLGLGQFEETTRWANIVLGENRCDEAAHRQIMLAYAAQGRRSDALRQFYSCEQVLKQELNIAPVLETVQLYQDILAGHPSSPHSFSNGKVVERK